MILALLLAISTATPAAADPDVEAVQRSAAELDPHVENNGTWLAGELGGRLLGAQWRAVQTWAAHWLDRHPGASPAALEKASEVLGKDDWSFSAASLGHGDILVSVARWQIGTAFILSRYGAGGYRLRWSVAAPQARLDPAADRRLSWWRLPGPSADCSAPRGCMMLADAQVQHLPDAANGAARFSINASYAREMGATGMMQLSFWSWQNGRARPLLFHEYDVMTEQDGGGLRGSVLHVISKGDWQTLFACGSCYGRETDLRFAVGPGPVRMLPPVSLTPEADLVDRVFTRVLKHQPVGTLASPAALRVIRQQLAGPLHVGSSRVDLQACKLEYSIVSPK